MTDDLFHYVSRRVLLRGLVVAPLIATLLGCGRVTTLELPAQGSVQPPTAVAGGSSSSSSSGTSSGSSPSPPSSAPGPSIAALPTACTASSYHIHTSPMLAGKVNVSRESQGLRADVTASDGCAAPGETIVLQAQAPSNFKLMGWTGDAAELCDASASTCTIQNLSRDLVVAADFRIQSFTHPGLLSTAADLERMKAAVLAQTPPIADDYQLMMRVSQNFAPTPAQLDAGARITYSDHAQAIVCRGTNCSAGANAQYLWWDVNAVQVYVYMWKMSGRREYADAAVGILNAWSTKLKQLDGYFDGFLIAGIQGYQLSVLGELLRDYDGWAPADFIAFKTMMRTVFVNWAQWFIGMNRGGLSTDRVFSNWDLAMENCILAYAVMADDVDSFNWVVDFFVRGGTNGALANFAYYRHAGNLVQTQESGRDQGHNTLSVMLATNLAEMAWNQGIDFYGWDDNRLLGAAEYVAKANLVDPSTRPTTRCPSCFGRTRAGRTTSAPSPPALSAFCGQSGR